MQKAVRTFCTIFPCYQDFHFYKDPGQIPYRFSKNGYNTSLICYGSKHGFAITERFIKIKVIADNYFTRRFNSGIIWFLLCNARRIDILNTFHLEWNSLLFSYIYKIINRKGFAYIKLDNCAFAGRYQWETDYSGENSSHNNKRTLKQRLKSQIVRRFLIRRVDLWSVEDEYSKGLFEERHSFFQGKLITVSNGHTSDLQGSVAAPDFKDKENIIMTAGRLGTYQKATEILLDSFKKIAPYNSYTLHLAGTVEPLFESYIEKFRHDNPHLNERIIFHGSLTREELQRLYSRSKIFCLPSRYEGMAIVFPEAMYYKNAVLTTREVSLKYLIDRYQAGMMVDRDNSGDLSEALHELINNSDLREGMAQRAHDIAVTLLNWDSIIRGLQAEIETRVKG